ncbi:ABC transporter ATP-binding protein [Planctomycetota bacterium]
MNQDNLHVHVRGVTKSYALGSSQVEVLKGVDLEVRQGEFMAVMGASGSGKSTLLHILGGLDRPDRGSVTFGGQEVTAMRAGALNRFRNASVGFVFQFYHLLDELNVLENVLVPPMAGMPLRLWWQGREVLTTRARDLLERFGLSHRLRHKPYQLSGGERQRVAVARALINEPPLLLADEPTGNLDSTTGNGILEVFEQLHEDGQTIVMVTHDTRTAERASRIVTLTDGVVAVDS